MAGTHMSGEQIKTISTLVCKGANWTHAKETPLLVHNFLFGNLTFGHTVFEGTLSATEVTL
jgi:hypothetical protein